MHAPWTTGSLAQELGAQCEGDPLRPLVGVASLADAGTSDLSFCDGDQARRQLERTEAGAVLISDGEPPASVVALRVPDPRRVFAKAAALLNPSERLVPGVHPSAVVSESAHVHELARVDANTIIDDGASVDRGAHIMGGAFIGRGVRIGADSVIFPNATVLEGSSVGARCRIAPGAVVGADGFGHIPAEPVPIRFPQLGRVVIEDDVDIGANSCVDRGALDTTRVERGARLDNLVQIGHGARVGARSLLAAFAGLAGRASLGCDSLVGGRASLKEGVSIGSRAQIAGHAGVTKNAGEDAKLAGFPARPHRSWLRELAGRRLADSDEEVQS